jgi:hypothetical protein
MDNARRVINAIFDKFEQKFQDSDMLNRFNDLVNQALKEAKLTNQAKIPPDEADKNMHKNFPLEYYQLHHDPYDRPNYSSNSSLSSSGSQSPHHSPFQMTDEKPNHIQNNIIPNINDNYNQNQNGFIKRIKNPNVGYMQNMNPVPRQDHNYIYDQISNQNVAYIHQDINPRQDYVYNYNQVTNNCAPYQQNMNQHPIPIHPVYNRLASQNDQMIYENPIEYQNYNHYQVQNQDLNVIQNFNYNLNNNLLSETLDAVIKKMLEPYLFGNEHPNPNPQLHENVLENENVKKYSPNKDLKLNDNAMPENKIAMNVHRWKHFDTIRNELNQKHK